jgi:hypothetical protein
MLNKQSVAMLGRIVVLASLTLLAGCGHNTHVFLIVHGPVVTAPTKEGTIILVPAVDPGDEKHFLATGYPGVGEDTSTPCSSGAYEFSLKGIKPAEKKVGANTNNGDVIDPAFDPITFRIPNWKPWKKQPYFMTMDLPAATKIAAFGERYPVQFQSGPNFVPLTQVLEFEVRDSDDIRLVRTCGSEKKEYKALSCKEMQARYDEVFDKASEMFPDAVDSRRYIDFALKSCTDDASYLFVGIGTKTKDPVLSEVHGRNFFNSKILPEIYGGMDNVPLDRKLVERGHVVPKGSGGGDYRGVRLIRTSFNGEDPLYTPVLLIENCTSPGGFVRP